jgi:hypothetical protein
MIDPYSSTIVASNRLREQYTKTPKLIIAVDHDDTVFDFHRKGHIYDRAIGLVRECRAAGFYVVIFTASPEHRYGEIYEYWRSYIGVTPDGINRNPVDLPYGQTGKIFYNLLLDDRAGLGQAMDILENLFAQIEENKNQPVFL